MKREIKFRGLKIDNNKLIYGQLLTNKLGNWIIEDMNPHYCKQYDYIDIDQPREVITETVGQYTGIKDKNGKEIYDGDIITDGNSFGFVFYNEDSAQFQVDFAPYDDCPQEMSRENNWMEVAGNIYENPGLLK